jgi:gluconokinase
VVSDGFSSNMGAGAVDESAVAASVATSGAMRVLVYGIPDEIPSGLWCYRVDGSRSLLGGAVNDAGLPDPVRGIDRAGRSGAPAGHC